MSAVTKLALAAAVEDHLRDEGWLRAGELVTDWLLLTAALPVERTERRDAVYTVTVPDHMCAHQALGLAAWYLHDRRDGERQP